MKTNPVIENIIARESCRKFKADKISREDIETIVTAGTYAPSAGGRQPWHIVVVTDPEIISFIGDDSVRQMSAFVTAPDSKKDEYLGNFKSRPILGGGVFAPMLILIFEPKEKTQDAASHLAAENMMLAARSLGIHSCWIGAVNANTINKNLESADGEPLLKKLIPNEDCHLACTLAFGYADEGGLRHPRLERRTDNIHYFL